ncbi:hypothetical protein J3Q64DRAFT_1853747 [Phycomyces blakesleeanus]|uniref:Retrotransposon gag domain-containing protein n=2 Tax=Phycomyces blakesleeanus TaxID=4837 RepID=A0A162WZV6_PHYB8|nr:hypothetical protein PHYBLDRAFT_72848 [Phycomyces blakesleeanus NRRL 1555(-)]OAD71735.1 hypothetical protein PHYBLDRAFT_72848 [Phycomyces blakesleeanus NRRL 1555(-)]|eukprot:XP_018289775.1 hypothetical protein PHYBLDRAFT_72848 [Phycomyces blakesleeanus NRRL 1555(-)]
MSLHIEPLTLEPSEHIPIYDDTIMEEPNQDIKKQAKTKLVQLIDSAKIKLCMLMVRLNQESMNNPDSQVLKSIQREMDVTNALLDSLQQYQQCNMFQDPKVPPDGISISFCNIPKFQIIGNNVRNPKEPVYDLVSHFLSMFQKILTAGKTNIDSAWKIWLPMSFDHDHDTWYESNLQGKDISWNDMKDIITKKFDSFNRQLEMGSLVFTMTMGPNESILNYGIKFQKACREGGVKENTNLAMRFMSSLTPELSSNVKLAWFAQYSEMSQMIEQESTFARNISSTIRMLLPTVACFKNTSTQRKPVDIATSLGNTATPVKSISKPKQGPIPLKVTYANGHEFLHSFELMEKNQEDSLILGQDILPKLGITLSGVAVDWNIKTSTRENQEIEDDLESNNSPYGTKEQHDQFMSTIACYIEDNEAIPKTSFCTVPESIVELKTAEGAKTYQRQYPLSYALRSVIDEAVNNWLKEGTIVRAPVNTA